MTSRWEIVRLGDVSDTLLGKTLPRGAGQTADGHPYLRNANVQWGAVEIDGLNTMPFSKNEREKYSLRKGDILACEGGEVGRCAILETDMPGVYFQNAIHRIRTKPGTNAAFVALALEQLVKNGGLEGITSQLTIAHLNQAKLRDLEFSLPSLAEQRRIVDLISSLDDAIEAADVQIENSTTLYSELLTETAQFNAPLAPLSTVLSEVKLREVVTAEGEYKIAGLERSGLGFIDRGRIRGEDISYPKLTVIREDQLIYRKLTAWEGPISVAGKDISGSYVSPEFPTFDVDKTIYLPGLLRHICRWQGFWSMMAGRLTGSVLRRKRLNPDQLLAIELPIPDLDEQQNQLDRLEATWERVSSGKSHAASLRKLRAELLTSLLSGAHSIPESYDDVMTVAADAPAMSVSV